MNRRLPFEILAAAMVLAVLGFGWWQSYRSADGGAISLNGRGIGASSYDGTLIAWVNLRAHSDSDNDGFTTFHDSAPSNPSPFGRFIFENESGSFRTDIIVGFPYPLAMILTLAVIILVRWRNVSSY